MDSKLREQAFERSGGYCLWCGKPMSEYDFAIHHRKLRSRGGEDVLPNLVAVHHKCHNLGTNSIHLNPATATLRGFMVSAQDDERVVMLKDVTGTMISFSDDRES